MKRPTVLLADDHAMVTEGLVNILKSDFDLVGTVSDGRELVAAAEELGPDVIVADISMPSLNGLEAVRQLKENDNRAKVVFLTMHADADLATEAFRAGASGYVLKHSAAEELIESIHEVLEGRVDLTASIQGEVLEAFMRDDPEMRTVLVTERAPMSQEEIERRRRELFPEETSPSDPER